MSSLNLKIARISFSGPVFVNKAIKSFRLAITEAAIPIVSDTQATSVPIKYINKVEFNDSKIFLCSSVKTK